VREGWSFCIVTSPGNEDVLIHCMNNIHAEFSGSENYEIIVVGNPVFKRDVILNKTQVIPFKEDVFHPNLSRKSIVKAIKNFSIRPFFYKTGAICHKKNLAAKHAKYTNLCIMHDYVGVERGWKTGFDNFGDNWDVCVNIILNQNGMRDRDWMVWDHPELIDEVNKISPCLLPYDKYTRYMYISGGYFCVKNKFYKEHPLDESLFWGEGEDIEWSLRVRGLTQFKMNTFSKVKYLKLKDITAAPYCKSWLENEKLIQELLRSGNFS
jgi:hypothetical protein